MIKPEEVFRIGKLLKPHGVKGEIAFAFDNDVFDRVDCPYLICLVDEIFVPFFVEEYRFKGSETALIKFEDVDTEERARLMSNWEVYFPRKYYEEGAAEVEYSWNYFIGFKVYETSGRYIGTIDAVDEATINVLFRVVDNGDEYLIPAAEDFIDAIDDKNKTLHMNLPEGLLD